MRGQVLGGNQRIAQNCGIGLGVHAHTPWSSVGNGYHEGTQRPCLPHVYYTSDKPERIQLINFRTCNCDLDFAAPIVLVPKEFAELMLSKSDMVMPARKKKCVY